MMFCNKDLECAIFKLLVVSAFLLLFHFLIEPFLRKKAEKTETEIDDRLMGLISGPTYLIIMSIAVYEIFKGFFKNPFLFEKILFTIITLFIAWSVVQIIDLIIIGFVEHTKWTKKAKEEFKTNAFPLIINLSRISIFLVAIMIILDKWGINISPLLASAGIVGLALGFALKDFVENTLSGIIILVDRPFKVGDRVELESGISGIIKEINIRTTKIKRYSNDIVIVPNSQMVNARIINYNLPNTIVRADVKISVEYGSDIEEVKKILLKTVKSLKGVLKEPAPSVLFLNMGDFSLDFKVFFYTDVTKKYELIDKYLTKVYKELNKKGIGIPFPTHTVYLRGENNEVHNKKKTKKSNNN